MNQLHTGQKYEIYGTPAVLFPIWERLKPRIRDSVLVRADSDNLATVGTDSEIGYKLLTLELESFYELEAARAEALKEAEEAERIAREVKKLEAEGSFVSVKDDENNG